jgi:hypothetical protein
MRRRELDDLIVRWKRATRALRIDEQEHGRYLTGILEMRTDKELALFTDPVEAAVFFCMLSLVKRSPGDKPGAPAGHNAGQECLLTSR